MISFPDQKGEKGEEVSTHLSLPATGMTVRSVLNIAMSREQSWLHVLCSPFEGIPCAISIWVSSRGCLFTACLGWDSRDTVIPKDGTEFPLYSRAVGTEMHFHHVRKQSLVYAVPQSPGPLQERLLRLQGRVLIISVTNCRG